MEVSLAYACAFVNFNYCLVQTHGRDMNKIMIGNYPYPCRSEEEPWTIKTAEAKATTYENGDWSEYHSDWNRE